MVRFHTLRNALALPLVIVACLCMGGCWYLIIGGVAAAGGYAISSDTIQGETSAEFEDAWSAATEVMGIMGAVESESYELGMVKGVVNNARVTVTVSQLTTATVRVKVKARKAFFPSIRNAQNVYIKIMAHLDADIE